MRRSVVLSLVCGAGVLLGVVGGGLARNTASRPSSQMLIPQFENAQVTVWKTVLAPHDRIGMHRHAHGRVVVALTGGTLTIPRADGAARQLPLERGKAYWLDADPPGELHGDVNASDRPLEMMVVELTR